MEKNKYWVSPNMESGWRKHHTICPPSKEEAMEGFNTLIGWCVGEGLEVGDFTSHELCIKLEKYLELLRK